MPDVTLLVVIGIVSLALLFDYTNGFHDAANSIATVVSTRVLSPRAAVLWAAAFSFGHGGNDAQKTMGIIAALLVGAGYLQIGPDGKLPVPLWIVLAAHTAIA